MIPGIPPNKPHFSVIFAVAYLMRLNVTLATTSAILEDFRTLGNHEIFLGCFVLDWSPSSRVAP